MIEKQIPSEMITVRPANKDDKAFIYATWLRGLYYGNPWFTMIHKKSYMDSYHNILDQLFKKPGLVVNVACLKDDQELILGYSATEQDILHWVFVKQAWRRFGIAKQLIPKDTKVITHVTTMSEKIRPKNWIFDPFKI